MAKPNIVFACKFEYALTNPDRFVDFNKVSAQRLISGMFNYFSNAKKRAVNMLDYYAGKINKLERANLVLENGKYATDEEIAKRKKEYLKYFNGSNLYKSVLSFKDGYLENTIEFEELEQKIVKEVMPRFLKYCGFKDINKMSYQIAFHTNAKHYHFHISFIEKEPNYICSNGKIKYRRTAMLSKDEKDFFKKEVAHVMERHKEFTPMATSTNMQIEELKKFFKPTDRNFILKNYEDLILEENLLKLGKLLNDKRKGKQGKIKYNSIYDKEIKDLTKNIKKYLFKNRKSSLYKTNEDFKKSLNNINKYFYNICKDNNIKNQKFKSDYSKGKEEYVDNYIYNAIVNHASYKYMRLRKNQKYLSDDDIIQEAILKMYKKTKKKSKYDLLISYLSNITRESQFKNKYKIEQSIKSINSEMEEAVEEFSKLFKTNENGKEESY